MLYIQGYLARPSRRTFSIAFVSQIESFREPLSHLTTASVTRVSIEPLLNLLPVASARGQPKHSMWLCRTLSEAKPT